MYCYASLVRILETPLNIMSSNTATSIKTPVTVYNSHHMEFFD